jgi:hypothetical protein
VVAGKRHKKWPGGPWCDGKRNVSHEHAWACFDLVHNALLEALGDEDYARAVAMCLPVIEKFKLKAGV